MIKIFASKNALKTLGSTLIYLENFLVVLNCTFILYTLYTQLIREIFGTCKCSNFETNVS